MRNRKTVIARMWKWCLSQYRKNDAIFFFKTQKTDVLVHGPLALDAHLRGQRVSRAREVELETGDLVIVETPGGGGFGVSKSST